jgi:DNA-binding SARP family transcriptional activator/tetratricopeptide (TPR) repeat protein
LTDENGRSIRLPRKAFVLAAYLAIDPPKGPLPRERAARLLWGDADPARRAGNLRQLLARVKDVQTEEGFELFLIDTDHVAIDPDAAVVDVSLVLGARADTTDRRLFDLCKAYCGDLLFGLDEGGEEFTRWLWSRRAMLRQQFVAVVSANVEASIGVLDPEEVLFVARRLIEADQYQETGHRALMRIHAARGELDSALRIHRRLVDLLRETGGRPSAATATLASEISARARPRSRSADEREGGAEDTSFEAASSMPGLTRSMRLPRLALNFAGLAALTGPEGQWAEALFDDAAVQLWRTRAFVVTRPADLRPRPIDLIDRARRDPCDYAVDCRVVGRDEHRQLTVSLVCSASGEILWIHRFAFGEPLARATRDIVVNCVHQIEQAELRALAEGPERTTAYRLTLQGNRLLRSIDLPSIRRARQIFRAALAVDPEHAPTLAAVSKAYRLEWLRLARADDKELDLAIDFARQAVTAGPEAAHGLHQLGICSIYKKRHEFGLEALQRAEQYMPYDEELIADYSDGLIVSGLANEGLKKISPLLDDHLLPSDQVLWIGASGQYLAGRFGDALNTLSRLASQEPVYQLKAACHAMLSQGEEAQRYARKLREILPDFKVSMRLGMVPLRRLEDIERYEHGLKLAGFD